MSGELIYIEREILPSAEEIGYSQGVIITEPDWTTSVFLESLECSASAEVESEV